MSNLLLMEIICLIGLIVHMPSQITERINERYQELQIKVK